MSVVSNVDEKAIAKEGESMVAAGKVFKIAESTSLSDIARANPTDQNKFVEYLTKEIYPLIL